MEIAHLLVNNFQGPFCLLIKQIGNWNPPNSHRMYILVFSWEHNWRAKDKGFMARSTKLEEGVKWF